MTKVIIWAKRKIASMDLPKKDHGSPGSKGGLNFDWQMKRSFGIFLQVRTTLTKPEIIPVARDDTKRNSPSETIKNQQLSSLPQRQLRQQVWPRPHAAINPHDKARVRMWLRSDTEVDAVIRETYLRATERAPLVTTKTVNVSKVKEIAVIKI